MNYFHGHKNHPAHLSVGAVVLNEKGEVLVHHITNKEYMRGYWLEEGVLDAYLLMRETVEDSEMLEHAVTRGIMEEFGATAEIKDYIGSIQSAFIHEGVTVEKTTIYFLCQFKEQDMSKRKGDIESKTDLEWHMPDFLIPKMKQQAIRYDRTDIDESAILAKL